jgi:hypothetical protein
MVVKRVLCPARVRKPPPQFSWVDRCASDISSVVMRTRLPCIFSSSPSRIAKASAITLTPLSSGVCRWTP